MTDNAKPTISLRGIRALLERCDTVAKTQSELPFGATTGAIQSELALVNWQLVHDAPETLRALLAVAEAAMEIETYQNSLGGGIPNNREVEHLMGLHDKYLK